MMKRFLFLALAALSSLLANSSPATAGQISPGTFNALPAPGDVAGTLSTAATYGGAVVNDTGLIAYSFGAGNTGTVRELVVADTSNPYGSGDLSFVFQIHVTGGDISRVTNSSYPTAILTDVAQGPALAPLDVTGTRAATSADRPTLSGNVVGFNFDPPVLVGDPSTTTLALIIRTNANQYGTGFIGLIDGGAFQASGFAPTSTSATPEPASVILLGFGAGGMLAYRWKRRQA